MSTGTQNSDGFPSLTAKSTLVGADIVYIADSAASNQPKQTLVSNVGAYVYPGQSVNVTASTQQMAVNTTYYVNYTGGACTLTLPTVASTVQNSFVRIVGGESNTAGFIIAQLATQQIKFNTSATTSGTGGSLTSVDNQDTITLVCDAASNGETWVVVSCTGSFSGV